MPDCLKWIFDCRGVILKICMKEKMDVFCNQTLKIEIALKCTSLSADNIKCGKLLTLVLIMS